MLLQQSSKQPLIHSSTSTSKRCSRTSRPVRVLSTAPEGAQQPAADQQPSTSSTPEKKDGWWKRDGQPNMIDVHGVQELVDQMGKAGDNLVIVDFYAPWCNACRALYPKICKLMENHQQDVVLLKMNWQENRDVANAMDVKVLPYFLFFRGAEGNVDRFSCTISKIAKFKEALEQYSGTPGFCSLQEPDPFLAEFPDVKPRGFVEQSPGPSDDPNSPTEVVDR